MSQMGMQENGRLHEQAQEITHKWSTDQAHELRILLTHGVLHLLGHDHVEPEEETVMFGRQRELVSRYEAQLATGAGE